MRGVNQHTVLGTLGKDPELRTTPSGAQVATFSLAVNEVWKDKTSGEQKESVEWVRCVAWNKAGEIIAQYCKKGQPLFVQGRQRTRKWEKDGVTHYATETMVDQFQLIAGKSDGGAAAADAQREEQHENSAPRQSTADFDDDIPF